MEYLGACRTPSQPCDRNNRSKVEAGHDHHDRVALVLGNQGEGGARDCFDAQYNQGEQTVGVVPDRVND